MYLHAPGHYHPETIIDNQFLSSLDIGVDEEWVLQRVGIRTRRTVLDLDYIRLTKNAVPAAAAEAATVSNAQAGATAARMALERAALTPSDIGMVVSGGCSPTWSSPAEACVVAAEVGIDAPAFDITSACSSFAVQLNVLTAMGYNLPDFILVVNVETNTRAVDYRDRRTAVLWGDAASAVIVSPRVPSAVRLQAGGIWSCPTDWDKVTIRAGGHFDQQGQLVQNFAIRTMTKLGRDLAARFSDRRMLFIGHQANLTALKSACQRAGIPESDHLYNVDRFGNCGAAGAPSVFSQHWSHFRAGEVAAFAVVGSGLTWSTVTAEFN
jgi:3-oxoacyl-[acyl-carrier-protein] synthase-3